MMKPTDLAGANSYRAGEPQLNGVSGDHVNLMRAAWRQRWVILPAIVVGIAAALLYLSRANPTFVSSGRLYVHRNVAPFTNPMPAGPDPSNDLNLQCEIIKSTRLVAAVAGMPRVKSLQTLMRSAHPVVEIQQHLKAEVDARSDVISVVYESSDPADGPIVVNAIIDQYVSLTMRQHHESVAEALRILERDKATRDVLLHAQIQQITKFKEANPALAFSSADRRSNLAVETVGRLSDALNVAKLTTIDASSVYDSLLQRSKMNLPAGSVVNDPLLRDELIRLQEHREVLRARLGENSQDVQSLDSALGRLQDGMAAQDKAAIDERVAAARQTRDAAVARQREIEAQLSDHKQLAISVAANEAQFAALEAELQRDQKLSDQLEGRINELNIAEDSPPSSMAILEPAGANSKAIAPQKLTVIAGGTLLGLLLGSVLACIRNAVSEHVGLLPDEIESQLGVHVLGSVPRASSTIKLAACGRLVALKSHNAAGDAYRAILTMIDFASPAESKTLLVTSPSAGDGKTSGAANLAIAFAQRGEKTLLIDADLRGPSVDKIFVDASKVGVSEVVAMRVKLQNAIQPTDIESLRVLHAGAPVLNPSEILSGRRFAELIAAVAGVYDKIIIDSPPLGLVPDAQIIAARTDATVLIVRAGRSSRPMSKAAAVCLAAVGAKVVGAILNAAPQRRSNAYYPSNALSAANADRKPASADPSDIPSVAPQAESTY